jgi:hypothetical protein
VSVPTCFPTVTAVRVVPPRYDAGEHATVDADVHEELLHSTASSSDAEGLGSFEAKLSPLMVTDTWPVCAAFVGLMLVKAGAAHSEQRSCCPKAHSGASGRTVEAELPGERPHLVRHCHSRSRRAAAVRRRGACDRGCRRP